jgi:hypothetical protein
MAGWWSEQPKSFRVWVVVGVVILVGVVVRVAGGTVDGPQTVTPVADSRCVDVPAGLVARIAEGLTVASGGTLSNASAVKSNDYEAVYFVAAEIDGPGMEGDGEVGVWAIGGNLEDPDLFLSVDGFAHEFSDWGYGPDTTFAVQIGDDGAREAQQCAGG